LSDGGLDRTQRRSITTSTGTSAAAAKLSARPQSPSLKVMPHGTIVEVLTNPLALRCAPRSSPIRHTPHGCPWTKSKERMTPAVPQAQPKAERSAA
jgi:hypothetical protein